MAIVRMKKLSLLATRSQKDEILRELMRLGCVELTEQDEILSSDEAAALTRESSDAVEWRVKKTALSDAIKLLDRYAPKKTPMLSPKPEMAEADFLDETELEKALAGAREIVALDERIRSDTAEENRQQILIDALTPYRGFDLPLDCTGTKSTAVAIGAILLDTDLGEMSNALTAALPESEIFEISSDESLRYLSVFYLRSGEEAAMPVLRGYGFIPPAFGAISGSAQENINSAKDMLEKLAADKAVCLSQIESHAGLRETLKVCCDRINTHVDRAEASELLLKTEKAVMLSGWMSAPDEAALKSVLGRFDCAYELTEPAQEEYPDVPVQLKNNRLTRPLNMVTEMYSLPAYDGVDPNPIMAPFFIFFYGFMMADMGYGLLMMLISLVVMKKAKPDGPTMRHMVPLLGLCGISTFIMGMLTGGFFGDLLPQLAMMINPNTSFTEMPALFSPLDDALMVLIGSLAIGVVQIFTGMAVSMYRQIKNGEVMAALCNEGAWYLVFILAAAGILSGYTKYGLIAALVVIVLTQGYGKKGIVGKVMGIGGSLYNNITGYFSDILSYSRLMALMLAGAVIAQVFNTLGAITGNVVTFFLISMVGNALNFALNILGCYVHDMRLQCLEFFGRFYSDGGKPFRPLGIRTQYVNVIKK